MNHLFEKRIKSLPQVLQDLVSEYNVEHRVLMNRVFQEYFSVIYTQCLECGSMFDKEMYYSIDYFINKKCNIKFHWCSENCFEQPTDTECDRIKTEYVTSVNDYLTNITIQLPRQTADFTTI